MAPVSSARARILEESGVTESGGSRLPPLADGKSAQGRRARLQGALGILIAQVQAAPNGKGRPDHHAIDALIQKFLSSEGDLTSEPGVRDAVLQVVMHGFEALERVRVQGHFASAFSDAFESKLSNLLLEKFCEVLQLEQHADNLQAVVKALPTGESLMRQPGKARLVTALCTAVVRSMHNPSTVFPQLFDDRFSRESPEWIEAVGVAFDENQTFSDLHELRPRWATFDRAQKEAVFHGDDPTGTLKFAFWRLDHEDFAIAISSVARRLRGSNLDEPLRLAMDTLVALPAGPMRTHKAALVGCAFAGRNTPKEMSFQLDHSYAFRPHPPADLKAAFLRGAGFGAEPLSVFKDESLTRPDRLAFARLVFAMPGLLRAEHAKGWAEVRQTAQLSPAEADGLLAAAGPANPAFVAAVLRQRMEALLCEWRDLPPSEPGTAPTRDIETKDRAGPSPAKVDAVAVGAEQASPQPSALHPDWGARAPRALALMEQIDAAYSEYARHTGLGHSEAGPVDAARPHVTPPQRAHWHEFLATERTWLESLKNAAGDLQDFRLFADTRLAALAQTLPDADAPVAHGASAALDSAFTEQIARWQLELSEQRARADDKFGPGGTGSTLPAAPSLSSSSSSLPLPQTHRPGDAARRVDLTGVRPLDEDDD